MSKSPVLCYRIIFDMHNLQYSTVLYGDDLKPIDTIVSTDIAILASLRSLLLTERPLYWDSLKQCLFTGELEAVGEGVVDSSAVNASGVRGGEASSSGRNSLAHLRQAQVFNLKDLEHDRDAAFEHQRELLRQEFPEVSDRYRHVNQYSTCFDVFGGQHSILLYSEGKVSGRISTANLFLFDLVLDVLRSGGKTVLWDHYSGVLVSEVEPVGGRGRVGGES